jgi:hypothetical protein
MNELMRGGLEPRVRALGMSGLQKPGAQHRDTQLLWGDQVSMGTKTSNAPRQRESAVPLYGMRSD